MYRISFRSFPRRNQFNSTPETMTMFRTFFAIPAAICIATFLLPAAGFAQDKLEFPAASAHALLKQRVGLTDFEVDYSRPNKNDRQIFGALVPFEVRHQIACCADH